MAKPERGRSRDRRYRGRSPVGESSTSPSAQPHRSKSSTPSSEASGSKRQGSKSTASSASEDSSARKHSSASPSPQVSSREEESGRSKSVDSGERDNSPRRFVDVDKIEVEGDVVELDVGNVYMYPSISRVWNEFVSGSKKLNERAVKYLEFLMDIRRIVTRAGARINGIRYTYRHDRGLYYPRVPRDSDEDYKMYLIVRLKGNYHGKELSTSLLVKKLNAYIVAYSTISSDGWLVCKDIDLKVTKGKDVVSIDAPFSSHYRDMPVLEYNVGGVSFLRALSRLEEGIHQGFQCVCYHVSEAVRFSSIELVIKCAMVKGVDQSMCDLTTSIVSWRKMSHYRIKLKYGNPKEDKFLAEGSTTLACGYMEFIHNKDARLKKQMENLEKKRLLKKKISIDDMVRSSIGNENAEGIKAARKEIKEEWEKTNDLDIWDSIGRIFSDPSLEIAKLAIYHANLIMINEDLSEMYSDQGVPYNNTTDVIKRYMTGHT